MTLPETRPHILTSTSTGANVVRLAGYSFLILFFELALIRYVPGYVRIVGFYVNFVLIAAFLGMSVGLLRADAARNTAWLAVPVLLALFVSIKVFSELNVLAPTDPNYVVWSGVVVSPNIRRVAVLPVALLLFALTTATFVPLGALLGREFVRFAPLHAYTINVGASLLGIASFGILSWARTPPLIWFAVGFAIWLYLSLEHRRFALTLLVTAATSLVVVGVTGGPRPEYWSPYYRINVRKIQDRFVVFVNGAFHQHVVNLDPGSAATDQLARGIRDDYLLPFRYSQRPDTALVVGAGTGNDVAVLLQIGTDYVDAVEIDPVILDIGRAVHFQQPYDDSRVHAVVNDARAFFKSTDQTYDVVVFGTLDSHTQLAGMGSLRLDNYVYTREAFAEVRELLKPNGTLILYHMSTQPFIARKLHRMLADVFGEPPVVLYEPEPRFFNYTFLAGTTRDTAIATAQPPDAFFENTEPPTDEWPYLYLKERTVPSHYLYTMLGVMLITIISVAATAGRALYRDRSFDGAMFFMGMGFLLVETKSVTEMSLLFGSTWTVNLLVFSSILVVILLANLRVLRHPPRNLAPLFAALFGSLALAYIIPPRHLLGLAPWIKWFAGGAIVALPILFAATIFAMLFRTRAASSRALAFNVLGAVAGGIVEYTSMVWGVKTLYIIAAMAYAGAWISHKQSAITPGSLDALKA